MQNERNGVIDVCGNGAVEHASSGSSHHRQVKV